MSKKRQRKELAQTDACTAAIGLLRSHHLLGPVARGISIARVSGRRGPDVLPVRGAYCWIEGRESLLVNDRFELDVQTWLGVLSLATLVLALGGPRRLPVPSRLSDLAAQLAALHWWQSLRLGCLPERLDVSPELLDWGRLSLEEIAKRLEFEPLSARFPNDWGLSGAGEQVLMRSNGVGLVEPSLWIQSETPEELFAAALVDNARQALRARHDETAGTRNGDPEGAVARARRSLVAHHPLLGALLSRFEVVEDVAVCQGMQIGVAAIHTGLGEIYVNPLARLNLEQAKFVLAHEALHAGLCHASRRQGRDPFLWNVACDLVINHWLVEMRLGVPPEGALLDAQFAGRAAEDIYRHIASDVRGQRRLRTLRGAAVDMLEGGPQEEGRDDRDDFWRRALAQGLDWHIAQGRGTLPAGLVEDIRVLAHPPIPWQARLAEWMRERFPLSQPRRSYARPSRRQSATPEIPRPGLIAPDDERLARTFGVVLDTSASMCREVIGKAIGAITSYAMAQDVRQVRLVYCDAVPYDEGYVPIEALAARVKVRGRGGTALQAAVTLLETRPDFPKDGPVLLITDGGCESDLVVRRDHAFLLTPGARLPFLTRQAVFEMR
ncbi:DUF2201 family putative metallopeptidase [Caldimonas tepidiphila]|uniref:vWA domain-containing protein n=1 Tax=Caldimonas tepidiphila TaxID=2315841 RepID=UPI000E5C0017|nr:hypothetical protein [Caldimonas tepidiphila]